MAYIADTFVSSEMGAILIDIFDDLEAIEHDVETTLTVTTELALGSVAVYFDGRIFRVEYDLDQPQCNVASVLFELTMAIEMPEDLRKFAADTLCKLFPHLV